MRAIGPSLNIPGTLADPRLDIFAADGSTVASNDNWRQSQQQEIQATGAAPKDDLEAAAIVTLPDGNFTAQVRGANGQTGIGIVEVYALDALGAAAGQLANISTRGNVGAGDQVLIGGFIVRGDAPERIVVRAIGPDLAAAGVAAPLADPVLELHNQNGDLIGSNDDWRSRQEQEIIATGLAPKDERDSAIAATVVPSAYTAIVRGKESATRVGLVEVYEIR